MLLLRSRLGLPPAGGSTRNCLGSSRLSHKSTGVFMMLINSLPKFGLEPGAAQANLICFVLKQEGRYWEKGDVGTVLIEFAANRLALELWGGPSVGLPSPSQRWRDLRGSAHPESTPG